jgi:lysophospholipase L1-like esterase
MKKILLILITILSYSGIYAQNDSIYFWKLNTMIHKQSIKTADLDSITFKRPMEPLTAGTSDFSKYIALGDSMSAGYCDGALFIAGQINAYPNILSQQFSLVGGGPFAIPFMNDNIGGLLLGGAPIQASRLYLNGSNVINVPGTTTTEITNQLIGPFNNMSVPGAKSFHLLAQGYGNVSGIASGAANPYFARFASSPFTTVLADAVAQNITFFSFWIGNNDVWNYATSGGIGSNQTGNTNPATYGSNDITDPNVFANLYSSMLDGLTANGAKGVVANIPYFNTFPFFTTVPTNPNYAVPASNTNQLNQIFGLINVALASNGQPTRFLPLVADDGNSSTVENNPLLIFDESLSNISSLIVTALTPSLGSTTANYIATIYGKARHASNVTSSRDYILLTAKSVIGATQTSATAPFNVIGISYPMQDNTTITATEATQLKTATDAYNASIQALAAAKGLAFVDINAMYNQLNNGGIVANGQTMTSTFITGGMFSLDGVHPSPRGNALTSNKFLEAINSKYGSNLQGVNIGEYPVLFPANL